MKILYYLLIFLSSTILLISSVWYAKATHRYNNKPNIVVLISWAMISMFAVVTYKLLVPGWGKSVVPILGVVMNFLIVGFIVFVQKNYLLLKKDIIIMICVIVISSILAILIGTKPFHVLIQAISFGSFFPLVLRIIDGKGKEPLGPWLFMFIGTLLSLAVVSINYTDFWSILHPVRALLCQSIVLFAIKLKLRRWRKPDLFWDLVFSNLENKLLLWYDNCCFVKGQTTSNFFDMWKRYVN